MLTRIFKNQYLSNIVELLSGNIISQLINFLSIPVLTIIYSPDEFGVYGSLLFSIHLCANFIGLKYEVSVIHPEDDDKGFKLYYNSILIALFFSIIIAFIFYFFSSNYIIITLCSLLLFLNNANNLMLTRLKRFKIISFLRVTQTIFFSVFPIMLFYLLDNKLYLVVNFLISIAISSLIGLIYVLKENSFKKISFDLSLLKDYKQYPLKAAPSGLVNSLSTYFPVFFINNYFDSRSAGFYFLIEKLLLAPISLISNAFSNVYRERAQKEFYLHKNYFNVTIKTIKLLVFISLIVFSLLALLNQFLVTNFLSKEWFEIITLIYIFIPFFAVKFISGPLMSGLYVKNRLGLDLILQFVYLIVIIFSCLFGFYYGSIKSLILCLSLLGSTYFSFLILINYKLSK